MLLMYKLSEINNLSQYRTLSYPSSEMEKESENAWIVYMSNEPPASCGKEGIFLSYKLTRSASELFEFFIAKCVS